MLIVALCVCVCVCVGGFSSKQARAEYFMRGPGRDGIYARFSRALKYFRVLFYLKGRVGRGEEGAREK